MDGTPIHYGNILLLARRGLLPQQQVNKLPQLQYPDDDDEEMENDENREQNVNDEEDEEVDEAQALAAAEALVALVADKSNTPSPTPEPCLDAQEDGSGSQQQLVATVA